MHGPDEAPEGYTEPDESTAPGMRGSLLWTFAMPKQVWFLMLLETLDHYRLGLRIMQSQYLVMEWGFSDVEAGNLLAVKGGMDVVFGIAGSMVCDRIGVRKTAIIGLSVGLPGRFIWSFSTNRDLLKLACFFFSPCGKVITPTCFLFP